MLHERDVLKVASKKKGRPSLKTAGQIIGHKGGKARAAKLSPERRSEISSQAAKARWK